MFLSSRYLVIIYLFKFCLTVKPLILKMISQSRSKEPYKKAITAITVITKTAQSYKQFAEKKKRLYVRGKANGAPGHGHYANELMAL